MLNDIATYQAIGRRAARAKRRGDASLYSMIRRNYAGMLAHEAPGDREAARAAYDAGYRDEFGGGTVGREAMPRTAHDVLPGEFSRLRGKP